MSWSLVWRSLGSRNDSFTTTPRLLIAHHTPSPPTRALLEEVIAGAGDPDLAEATVILKPALIMTAVDVLEADGYLLGTPANFGYMSEALKHMFDQKSYGDFDGPLLVSPNQE